MWVHEQVPRVGVLRSKESACLVMRSSDVVLFAWSGGDFGVTFDSILSRTMASCTVL